MARTIKAGNRRVKPSTNFAGPNSTFPINTLGKARNALDRLNLASPDARSGIKTKIYAKYPSLREPE